MTGDLRLDPRLVKATTADQRRRLCALGLETFVDAGEVLVRAGEVDRALVFVLEGGLELVGPAEGRGPTVTVIDEGESVGAMALLGLWPRWSSTLRAGRPTRLLVFGEELIPELKRDRSPVLRNIEQRAGEEAVAQIRRSVVQAVTRPGRDPEVEAPGPGWERLREQGHWLWSRLLDLAGPPQDAGELLASALDLGSEEEARRLAEQARWIRVRADTTLLGEGAPLTGPVLVVEGRLVAWSRGREHARVGVAERGPGGWAGVERLVDPGSEALRWSAAQNSLVLGLPSLALAGGVEGGAGIAPGRTPWLFSELRRLLEETDPLGRPARAAVATAPQREGLRGALAALAPADLSLPGLSKAL